VHVLATAGHVDHGKSTLVKTLTGTDPDRLDEERERGLTIDLGFGSMTLPSGEGLAFVDVPGHVRFLKNMLAGVGAVDATMFVVAATEGWKPQSEEHLRILELLGLKHGLIALTKVGMADDDLRELARLDVEEHVEGTFLEDAEIIEVDAIDGIGMDDLREALDRLASATPIAADEGEPRLWIDRAFAAKGAGTIVTGTLTGGGVAVDDEYLLAPVGRPVRVRAIQSHYAQTDRVTPGHRVALNLTGVSHDQTARGDVLVRPDTWWMTKTVDCSLSVLDSLGHEVSRRGAHVAYIGSGEFAVNLRVLGDQALAPGTDGFVRLHLPTALPIRPGDRFILRESGRSETVGGGQILDIDPQVRAALARPDRSVDRVITERGWVEANVLRQLTGETRQANIGRWVAAPAAIEKMVDEVRTLVDEAGPLGLDIASLDDRQRAALETINEAVVNVGRVTLGEQVDPLAGHRFIAELEAAPFSPPAPEGHDPAEVRELVRRGLVVAKDGVWFAPSAIDAAARRVAEMLATKPSGVTVAEVRDAFGCTRKHALPLLAILDGTGVTRRREDVRIGGPRLPEV